MRPGLLITAGGVGAIWDFRWGFTVRLAPRPRFVFLRFKPFLPSREFTAPAVCAAVEDVGITGIINPLDS
jgi:hypothetical protein